MSLRKIVFVPESVAAPLVKVSRSDVAPMSNRRVAPLKAKPPLLIVSVRPVPSVRLIVELVAFSEEMLEESALAPLKAKVPLVTETAPLLEFVPFSVRVPAPDFVKLPAPWSEPAKVCAPVSATV
jgi:hypothetical protein